MITPPARSRAMTAIVAAPLASGLLLTTAACGGSDASADSSPYSALLDPGMITVEAEAIAAIWPAGDDTFTVDYAVENTSDDDLLVIGGLPGTDAEDGLESDQRAYTYRASGSELIVTKQVAPDASSREAESPQLYDGTVVEPGERIEGTAIIPWPADGVGPAHPTVDRDLGRAPASPGTWALCLGVFTDAADLGEPDAEGRVTVPDYRPDQRFACSETADVP